jgi:hypothetical protein
MIRTGTSVCIALALKSGRSALAQEDRADIGSAIEAERQKLSEQRRILEQQFAEYEARKKRLDR